MRMTHQAEVTDGNNTIPRIFVTGLLLLWGASFVAPPLAPWIGAVMTCWLIGTQPPLRGFLLIVSIGLIVNLIPRALLQPVWLIDHGLWVVGSVVLFQVPFLVARMIAPRLPGFVATLVLPLAGAVVASLSHTLLPPALIGALSPTAQAAVGPLLPLAALAGSSAVVFLVYWFGAIMNWLWEHDLAPALVWPSAVGYAVVLLAVAIFSLTAAGSPSDVTLMRAGPAWPYAITLAGLGLWALQRRDTARPWALQADSLALLRSPETGATLQRVDETLVSATGEQFPINDGMVSFARNADMVGLNQKYARLYATIAGFYDSAEAFAAALLWGGQERVRRELLQDVQVEPGDRALETSIGTGMNLRYLPDGVRWYGLDLSPWMLAQCRQNLIRWRRHAELFHGNAERLPFADASFDQVIHLGGINFFNNKAAAINEMIRVAKPGSPIVIGDETEQWVRQNYAKMPLAGRYFRHRSEAEQVTSLVELLPPEVQDVQMKVIWSGRFYSLRFRKP